MPSDKQVLKNILKIGLAGAIIYWLVSNGKLDFSLILKTLEHPSYFIIGILLVSFQLVLGSYRLAFLLGIKSKKIKGKNLIGPQWVGQFFSLVLPGGFTSDLVKIGYVHDCDKNLSKSYIIFSMLLDRIIGLNSLLFIAGVTSLFYFNQLTTLSPAMEKLIYINLGLFLFSLIEILLIFVPNRFHQIILKFIPTTKLKEIAQEAWKLKNYKLQFLVAYFSSIIGHMCAIFAFYIINLSFFESPIGFEYMATLIPLGQLAVVIPISPGGIGVGHAAFSTLFHFIGHTNGASLFNVYWVMTLVINLFGIFPFILNKKKINEEINASRHLQE